MSDHIVSYWTQFRRDKNGLHALHTEHIIVKNQLTNQVYPGQNHGEAGAAP